MVGTRVLESKLGEESILVEGWLVWDDVRAQVR